MTMHTQGKVQAQKKPEKTLNLHLRIILGTKTVYNNLKIENNKQKLQQKRLTLGKENLISRITALLDLNV